jgi:hypothetical protein
MNKHTSLLRQKRERSFAGVVETGIDKEVEICATNLANKTKCMSTNAKKWGENFEDPLESTVVYYQIK